MQRSFGYALGFTALVLGCGSETPQPAGPPDGSEAEDQMVEAGAQTKRDAGVQRDASADSQAPAVPECAAKCERQANELAQSLETAASDSLEIEGGECARVDIDGVVAGMACMCNTSNGWMYIGPEGAGCFARGRAGDCLWDDSEFEACSQGDPACYTKCEELEKRFAADAAKSFDVEVRYSSCSDESCHYVLRIEDDCYADRSYQSGRHFDCSLSDAEILEREARAQKSQ